MAKKSIGKLAVFLSANTKGLTKGFGKAVKSAKAMAAKFKKVGMAAVKFGAAVVAAGVAIAAVLVRGQLKAVDALAKTSDRLGIATEKLAGLQLAANLAGASNEQLSTGLRQMARQVSDAAQGTGEAVGALRDLGLDAEALNRLSPDQQFRAIADAMNGVANQGDRVRLAMDIFGRQGATLLNTMQGGAAALDEAQAQAERFGLAISRVDAAKIEAANDAVLRMRSVFVGAVRSFTVSIAPAIANLATKVTQLAGVFRERFGPVIQRVGQWLMTLAKVWLANTIAVWVGLAKTVGAVAGAIWSAVAPVFGGIGKALGFTGDGLNSLTRIIDGFRKFVVKALAVAEWSFLNMGTIARLVLAKLQLGLTVAGSHVAHMLGTVIPTWLNWLFDNWEDVFTTLWRFTKTVFENITNNILDIFENLPALIRGQKSLGDIWRPLTDGFESAIQDLPEIADREITKTEKRLRKQAESLENAVAEGMGENIAKRLAESDASADAAGRALDGLLTIDIAEPAKDAIESLTGDSGLGGAQKRDFGQITSGQRDRLLAAAQGAQVATAKAMTPERKEQKKQTGLLERIAENTATGGVPVFG